MKVVTRTNIQDDDLLKQVCETRGVSYRDLQDFITPTKTHIQSPKLYKNLVMAADILIDVVSTNKKIVILVDSDADGYCSSALLYLYLTNELGALRENVQLLFHEEKSHGLTKEIMDKLSKMEYDIILIPDAGSNDYKQHEELYNQGKLIIVIDHHECEGYSDHALVVNNQLNDDANKTLSGAGVVLKVLEEIDARYDREETSKYYDIVAVALVGDSVPTNNLETRYYINQGLTTMNCKVINELFKAQKERSLKAISYDIAPTINAFIRVGTMAERQDLFCSLIGIEIEREITIRGQGTFALPLHEYIARLSSRIKSRQTSEINKALAHEDTEIISDNYPITICLLNEEAPRSLTGLIGSRLVDQYNKPAIVMKNIEGVYRGSGRTLDTFENFKDYCNDLELFDFAQGHQPAFGVGITSENLKLLLDKIAGQKIEDFAYVVDRSYTDIISAYDIMKVCELSKYWGRGFDEPQFHVRLTGLNNKNVQVIGAKKDTIKITKNNISFLKFKCETEEIRKILSTTIEEVEMIGKFAINEWNERIYPQIIIDHLEVKGKDNNYSTIQQNGFSTNGFNFGGLNLTW